jgi:hypothetical protein
MQNGGHKKRFKHTAVLLHNGSEVYKTKVCYLNRTWECFTYETVLFRAVEGYFEGAEQETYKEAVRQLNPYGGTQVKT